jgi:hypothetical protein
LCTVVEQTFEWRWRAVRLLGRAVQPRQSVIVGVNLRIRRNL